MSTREDILTGLDAYNVYRLEIDRDADIHGDPAIKYEVFMENPLGIRTGLVMAEFHISKANAMKNEDLVTAMKSYLNNSIKHFEIEVEE